jgi:hypothetical protein
VVAQQIVEVYEEAREAVAGRLEEINVHGAV